MTGLRVQCPNCKRVMFETTDKYLPDHTPNGSWVRSLAPHQIDWLTSSTTLCSEMTCPACEAPLAPSRRLVVLPPPPEIPAYEMEGVKVQIPDGSLVISNNECVTQEARTNQLYELHRPLKDLGIIPGPETPSELTTPFTSDGNQPQTEPRNETRECGFMGDVNGPGCDPDVRDSVEAERQVREKMAEPDPGHNVPVPSELTSVPVIMEANIIDDRKLFAAVSSDPSKTTKALVSFPCPVCHKTFESPRKLQGHMGDAHKPAKKAGKKGKK